MVLLTMIPPTTVSQRTLPLSASRARKRRLRSPKNTRSPAVASADPQPTNGSALATAGDLVFFGDLNRRLRALDADNGKVLWETVVGGIIVNSTISYAVNGKQYIMVFTGSAQSATTGPLGVAGNAMPPAVTGHNAIYVFALP